MSVNGVSSRLCQRTPTNCSDHIEGLGVLTRRKTRYRRSDTTRGTRHQAFTEGKAGTLGELPGELFRVIEPDSDICIDDLQIHAFRVSHDAKEPVAYTVTCGEKKAGVITDLGYYDDYIVNNLTGSQAMLVEANHDVNLLQVGSYPYYLKQRILGNKGHLSNEVSGKLINDLLNDNVNTVLLGHLSKENNYDKLAFETVRLEIDMSENGYKAKDFDIEVAKRSEPSRIITL
ncbi:MAG: MBL fold metallo-hydrolase [Lachnospira sp.]